MRVPRDSFANQLIFIYSNIFLSFFMLPFIILLVSQICVFFILLVVIFVTLFFLSFLLYIFLRDIIVLHIMFSTIEDNFFYYYYMFYVIFWILKEFNSKNSIIFLHRSARFNFTSNLSLREGYLKYYRIIYTKTKKKVA